jgi:hypothetical protein
MQPVAPTTFSAGLGNLLGCVSASQMFNILSLPTTPTPPPSRLRPRLLTTSDGWHYDPNTGKVVIDGEETVDANAIGQQYYRFTVSGS